VFFSWIKNRKPSFEPGQVLSFSQLKDQDYLELSIALEPCDTRAECVCFLLKSDGLSSANDVVHREQQKDGSGYVEWFEGGDEKQGVKLYASRLPEEIQTILMVSYATDDGRLDEWGRGVFVVSLSHRQSWEWSFHGARLGSGSLLKLVCLKRQPKGAWNLEMLGGVGVEDIDVFAARFFPRLEVEEVVPAVARVIRDKKDLMMVSEDSLEIKKIRLLAPDLLDYYRSARDEITKIQKDWKISVRTVLMLDYTVKMMPYYQDGQMQTFINQMMALSTVWDESSQMDCFLMGQSTGHIGTLDLTSYSNCVAEWMEAYELGSKITYGKAFEAVRRQIYPRNRGGKTDKLCVKEEKPVCIICLMSHPVEDANMAQWQLRWASYEPLFWEFIAVTGVKGYMKTDEVLSRQGGVGGDFRFLDQLNHLDERVVENAGYLTVGLMGEYVVQDMYGAILKRYTDWLAQGIKKGMVRSS
jgi:vWA found in TerF C terminus